MFAQPQIVDKTAKNPIFSQLSTKILPQSLAGSNKFRSFALPFEKVGWTYVTENPNQITVLRPQSGR